MPCEPIDDVIIGKRRTIGTELSNGKSYLWRGRFGARSGRVPAVVGVLEPDIDHA